MIQFVSGFIAGLPVGGVTVILLLLGVGAWFVKRALSQ